MKKLGNLKRSTRTDFATYLGVIIAFIVMSLLQSGGFLSRSLTCLLYTSRCV